jgi:hypothetical protein
MLQADLFNSSLAIASLASSRCTIHLPVHFGFQRHRRLRVKTPFD